MPFPVVLLHNKGGKVDLKNHHLICLLPHIQKMKIITNRPIRLLDEQNERQPMEKAEFQVNYSTMEHIFTLNQLLERSREYQLPLCFIFFDYEEVFDSVEVDCRAANSCGERN